LGTTCVGRTQSESGCDWWDDRRIGWAGGNWVDVFGGAGSGSFGTLDTAGPLEIVRAGSTTSAYFDNESGEHLVYSTVYTTSPVNFISITLQNNIGSNDPTSVTFSNFSITGESIQSVQSTPEPSTAALLLGSGLLLASRRRLSSVLRPGRG
jgi:hypothetical protein